MPSSRKLPVSALTVAAVSALAVAAVATGASAAAQQSQRGAARSLAAQSGTVTWAEQPGAPPDFILPYTPPAYASVNNGAQFQVLMYRPLYWFGNGSSATLNTALSLASPPVFKDDNSVAVVNMKHWIFSDGEPVDATSVMAWINMLKAAPEGWAAYLPGAIPDNIVSAKVTGKYQLTLQLTRGYDPLWFTYNELSQISPMPGAWDVTSVGAKPDSGGCATAAYSSIKINPKTFAPLSASAKACVAVYDFLSRQAGYDPTNPNAKDTNVLATYATNPLWQVVDGPWRLESLTSSGQASFVPNPRYSGPDKPHISRFVEVPFTSTISEYDALAAKSVDVGYLPSNEISAPAPQPGGTGPNNPQLASNYYLETGVPWAVNYFVINFNSTGDHGVAGKILRQLYVRQAMADLLDQQVYVSKVYRNYAVANYGPVPTRPSTWSSPQETVNPYPYDPARAAQLLGSHGWSVVPGGISSCTRPGSGSSDCGAGIPKGAQLAFDMLYGSGISTLQLLMNDEAAAWSQVGIKVTLYPTALNSLFGETIACPTGCSWELSNWGTGWTYDPDYYPTGGEIFGGGSVLNDGSYSDPVNDANITRAHEAPLDQAKSTLFIYEDYLERSLPVIWQPLLINADEVVKGLNIGPLNPVDEITPESWYFTK